MLWCWNSLQCSTRLSRSTFSDFPFPGKYLFFSRKRHKTEIKHPDTIKILIVVYIILNYDSRDEITSICSAWYTKLNQQEGETKKCRTCASVFHKNCFKKLAACPCGVRFKLEMTPRSSDEGTRSVDSNLNVVGGTVESSTGLLSGLFSKVMPSRAQVPKMQVPEGFNNVISMGSLPNTSL